MATDEPNREQGVNFGSIDEILEEIAYPISTDQLVDRYGDHEIERTNTDPISIRELFESMGTETFNSPDEIRQGVLNIMPDDAVGREGYSDRGGSLDIPGEDESV